jgi:tetratricopeptide (TPR) repeat protein
MVVMRMPSIVLWVVAAAALAADPAAAASPAASPAPGACHERPDPIALEADPRTATGPIAPVLKDLGKNHHAVTTKSQKAQAFFDQGLLLTYGFNHMEALRAFKEAARLDPDCVMAYWGWALVLGPNLNLPMKPEMATRAWEALQMAQERKEKASPKERDYIEALATRYAADPEADRAALDRAFADAMRALHRKYPEDNDAATLFAASLMEASPWNYWTRDGKPHETTPEILATLEGVIARDPEHEGALHYYIHAVEAADPMRGLKAADTLIGLAPGAGHLVHMPSHIWIQLGRYRESFDANGRAAQADEGYITQCMSQGLYPLGYYPHNVHFQAWAALLQGRSAAALEMARKLQSKVPQDLHGNDWSIYETFLSMPLFAMVRFGLWEQVLAEPRPKETTPYWTGIWHFARGMAYAHTRRPRDARAELLALSRLADAPASAEHHIGFSNAGKLLSIAREVLGGEIDAKAGRFDAAIRRLDRAARLQDGLAYTEPPDWYYPVRHTLGAVLLEAGRPDEAESVYWQDLKKNRENGYALFGLVKSYEAQGRAEDASAAKERFHAAWSDADVTLTSSRF